jgi:hypothetical protein
VFIRRDELEMRGCRGEVWKRVTYTYSNAVRQNLCFCPSFRPRWKGLGRSKHFRQLIPTIFIMPTSQLKLTSVNHRQAYRLASTISPLNSANHPAFQSYLTAHPCDPKVLPGTPNMAPLLTLGSLTLFLRTFLPWAA